MDIQTLLQSNLPALIASAAAIIGSVVTLLVTTLKDHLTEQSNQKQKRLEWQKEYRDEHILQPIIKFIDEHLTIMDMVYVAALNKTPPEYMQMLEEHSRKYGITTARVGALQDTTLTNIFEDFSRKLAAENFAIAEHDVPQAYTRLVEAQELASKVISQLLDISS